MWNNWRINWKTLKTKLTLITVLIGLFCTLTGFSNANIQDNSHVLNHATKALITAKNDRYWQTGEQPQIVVRTLNRIDGLTPKNLAKSKRTVFIIVGTKGKKRNVQIFSSKDLHAAFTADTRGNIIRSQSDQLRSNNKTEFNKGLRFVFRACATTIDQQYQYSFDKYDLTNDERSQIAHPHRLALPIALALVIVVAGLYYFFRHNLQPKNRMQK
ncbi:TPM domain-containing protein [Lactobacillus sp. ESL0731]|uniref:TPM domain-containing protein n=1 Tax=unclassified Lactobacillus TaxID=2620435 RepID=UPI0023FA4B3F|nr:MULTISPECIES: TPM domain-containing protein [unclassified Lactobacillus]WEV52053.1 TPM domain-containing protein [Lactobacillus sp. ESL0700]WEV63180.1 TPM domain-containing protein [Lactobacillus sp. ESL0731]